MGQEIGQSRGWERRASFEIAARIANPPPGLLVKYSRKEREFFFDYANFVLRLIEDPDVERRIRTILEIESIRLERLDDLRVMVFPAGPIRGRPDRMLHGSYSHSAAQISLYPLKLPRDWVRHDGSDLFRASFESLSERKRRLLLEIAHSAVSTLVHEVLHVKFEKRGLLPYVEEAIVRKLEKQYMGKWDELPQIVNSLFDQNTSSAGADASRML